FREELSWPSFIFFSARLSSRFYYIALILSLASTLNGMKKVLIITYYWPPAGGAGVQRWVKLSDYLLQFNIQPIILTVNEAHASYMTLDHSLSGEVNKDIKVYKTKSFEPINLYAKLVGKDNVPTAGFS